MISVLIVLYAVAVTALAIDQRMTINDYRLDLKELAEIRDDLVLKLEQAEQDRRVLGNALVSEVEENL